MGYLAMGQGGVEAGETEAPEELARFRSTSTTFSDMPTKVNERSNVFVMIGEAHRTPLRPMT